MSNFIEKTLQFCIYDYLVQKGLHESAQFFLEETGLQNNDLAIHLGPHFFTDWWDQFHEAYFLRRSDTSQNPLPEFEQQHAVTMPNPDMSFPSSSSSVPNENLNLQHINVDNENLINSNSSLNNPGGHWQQTPQYPHQYQAKDQNFNVGVGEPNPLSFGTSGMLSDDVGSSSVSMRGLSFIDQSISNPQNFGTHGMLDSSQPIAGLSSSGDGVRSSLMPMSGLSLADQSTSVGLERQNPQMLGTYGMPNSSQPIAQPSSSGDGVVKSSTSMKESASIRQTGREQLMRALSKNRDIVARVLKANPAPRQIPNNLGDKTALGGTSGTNANIDNSANNGSSLAMVKFMSSAYSQLICCDFSSEGDMLACVTQEKMVVIWNTKTNQFVTPESQHRGRITDARFVPYTSFVAASSLDKTVEIWDANKPTELLQKLLPAEAVVSMDFNPIIFDQLCCADKNEIRMWNVTQNTNEIFFQGAARQVRFKPGEGNVLAVLLMANEIGLFDVRTKSLLFSIKGNEKAIHTICWDATGEYIASVSKDEARVWGMNASKKPIHEIKSTGKRFYSCTVHPELAQSFVIGSHQSLEVWRPSIRNNTESIIAHTGNVSALCTSSKTGLIASTSNTNCIKLWKQK